VHALVTLPLHEPPQLEPSVVHAGRGAAGAPVSGEHVPAFPFTLQEAHWSPHAESQHTPSTQNPLVHCEALVHGEPSAPPIMAHCPPTQMYPAEHELVVGGGQAPAAQFAAGVYVVPVQLCARQLVVG
jgi:hypothetical protein